MREKGQKIKSPVLDLTIVTQGTILSAVALRNP
jgi:hypothetical protein